MKFDHLILVDSFKTQIQRFVFTSVTVLYKSDEEII